jgi:hypothetical protein
VGAGEQGRAECGGTRGGDERPQAGAGTVWSEHQVSSWGRESEWGHALSTV